MADIFIKHI